MYGTKGTGTRPCPSDPAGTPVLHPGGRFRIPGCQGTVPRASCVPSYVTLLATLGDGALLIKGGN